MNISKAITVLNERPWLIAIISFLLVAVILIAGHQSFKATEQATFNEFNQRQLVMARGAVAGIELYFRTLAEAMHAMARMDGVRLFDENTTRDILALEINELERLGVNDIGVLDAHGVLKFSARAPHSEGDDFSQRRYYLEAKEMTSYENYIIRFIDSKSVETGKQGIVVGVPMFEAQADKSPSSPLGQFAAVAFCTLNSDYLIQKFVAPVKSTEGGHAFLIDDGSRVLWASDSSLFRKNLLQEVEGFPSFQQILERMTSGDSGTAQYSYYRFDDSTGNYSKDKEEKLIAYVPARLGAQLWSLGIWAPKEDARRLIRSAYVKHLLLVALITISILLGCSYALAMSLRYNRTLEGNVKVKTKEFQESHRRLLTVMDSLDAAVYVVDLETHEILDGNKYVRDLFGDVVGKTCWRVLPSCESGPCSFCTKEKLLTPDGKPAGVNVREVKNPTTGKWYEIRDRAIHWVDGRIVKLEIAADITDRKRAEEDLKRAEGDLKRAHHETQTFYRILKQIGVQRTLAGVGSFLMRELQVILRSNYMMLYVFSSDRNTLFALSDKGTETIKDEKLFQTASSILLGLEGVTTSHRKLFTLPLIPDSFPTKGQQILIPLRSENQVDGALVVVCRPDCPCTENELGMVALALEQASGTIKRAVLHAQEICNLQKRLGSSWEFSGIIGRDPKMQVIYQLIEDIAPSDAAVLIQGESGTGKELVAHAIHHRSPRRDKPFVVINCSAYPATLLQSELFGHEKGAFTGAIRRKSGRFEQAHGGTVFLDEIGEVPLSFQIKLLRVLQDQKFERLGGEKTLTVDVRILAASNKDLLQGVKKGEFREDLYYRINVIPIHLPPLRKRRNDIPLLARHFLSRFSKEQGQHIQGFTSEAMRLLLDYNWPGNVRELENSVEHASILAKGDQIEVSDLPTVIHTTVSSSLAANGPTIIEQEKKLVQEVLGECGWNKKEAARRLGISRTALYDKLKRYQITPPTTH
jgi:PAS domain S-box-containing protein